jgi:hypothetical protein
VRQTHEKNGIRGLDPHQKTAAAIGGFSVGVYRMIHAFDLCRLIGVHRFRRRRLGEL